ncbi:helix-turn-helix domain-containing protein [Diaphorobacter sp. HDW4A]|uniref:IclR family transcriptional regulator n=1 Tax=Diaphorobacter sp. HDW4A TaxID=2714924 RepID=UPI00140BE59C|nr:helix-turn-helix domain-containing protein [Diaphorobacter sp. HDW4A]QIL80174.1 helix-turn-helix domain-containing protein [Diaphorobacter sp. HDW4A]
MAKSTRALTHESQVYVRSTAGSQSLERGLSILRAFRHGVGVLSNSELAERVQLPRPTVSRLTRSLVDAGFLIYDFEARSYRLAPVCLTLALSFRSSEATLEMALPHMRALAEGRRVNVGLAVADRSEMVYLDSVRLSRLGIFRRLSPGSRIPIAQTSLGCAYLAGMAPVQRRLLLDRLKREHGASWPPLKAHVERSLESISERGFCGAQWAAGMAAVATPLQTASGLYALNVSFPVAETVTAAELRTHGELLLDLKKKLLATAAMAAVT